MRNRLVLLVTLLSTAPLLAEKPLLPADTLKARATHIVTGTVAAIYTRVRREGGMEITRYVAEVKVAAVEKGEGVAAKVPLYVRYWSQRWTGRDEDMPAGTVGHRPLPAEGKEYRFHLARNAPDLFGDKGEDGGYNVLGPNGVEPQPERK